MNIESIIGLASGLIGITGAVFVAFKWFKHKPLTSLMDKLADKTTTLKQQHRILVKINAKLLLHGGKISSDYINQFQSDGRSKLAIFYDICNANDIEPTPDICKMLLGYDEKKFRSEWRAKHLAKPSINYENSKDASNPIIYMSQLLAERYPVACKRLTDILQKHNVAYEFLEGTKDIWCRDYMPVQTPSDKLVQFRYDPSYLRDAEYSITRSDVKHVDNANGLSPIFSDINLDGGNVVMHNRKAIVTDRVFSENPDWEPDKLRAELSRLLECEIIIIPAYKSEYDFTGHADGMVRFIDDNTVLVNNLDQDFKYMREGITKALDTAGIKYINFPYFDYKIKDNRDHAIGIYINYLEVGNLIVMPVFGVEGNKDAEALATLKESFPHKNIETIDYNEVALQGGLLNCTTWLLRK